jgi:hypothetical protein
MTRLRYHTVFDVPGAGEVPNWMDAWTGGEHVGLTIVFPAELLRFAETYRAVPAPPARQLVGRAPYVVGR